jgi:heat shock protein HtpX
MWLQTRMFLLVALLFGILYGVITAVGTWLGVGGIIPYLILAFVFLGIQFLISPAIVSWTMRVKWVSEDEAPELHRLVAEEAEKANIPKPKIGISQLSSAPPNAFAFGRTYRDGRVCVTPAILRLLNKDELRSVLGHEISHIKHRDMAVITLLSVIPLIMYWLAWSLMFQGSYGGSRKGSGGYAVLIGLGAFLLYFITNLLVLYGSRIREYYADRGSVELGNRPHYLATALYKLVHGNARSRKEELKEIEGVKAFFINDPSQAQREIRELSQIDLDTSGTIDADELLALRSQSIQFSFQDKMMEILSTHPNMLKRMKYLSSLA